MRHSIAYVGVCCILLLLLVPPACADRAPAGGSGWVLTLVGNRTVSLSQEEFTRAEEASGVPYTDGEGDVYRGLPLTRLIGLVDDGNDASYNTTLAEAGYSVTVRATDWHDRIISSTDITPDGFLVASTRNGAPLPAQQGDIKIAPLLLVGPDVSAAREIGNIMDITLSGPAITGLPAGPSCTVTILRRESDGGRILNATTVSCSWMEEHCAVHGDTEAPYRFQGPTFDTGDRWNPAETKNLAKVEEVVQGTTLRDLCDLVGGMREGDELRMTATDGYVVELMYDTIYAPKPAQGTAILAWWTEKQGHTPTYTGGPALFFLADDHTFGNQDMRECIDERYWRFYWCQGTEYPSAAGLAIRNVDTLEIYPRRFMEWELVLEGHLSSTISKREFEQGVSCGERARGHAVAYTDTDGRVWTGMPLYMLAGWVDDDCQHDENLVGNRAYNTTLARDNAYTVVVAGNASESAAFDARDIMKSHGYIMAYAVDGAAFAPGDGNWPLTLVGSDVPADDRVRGVRTITLVFAGPGDGVPASPCSWLWAVAALAAALLFERRARSR
ncbi:MAG: hypothetical protein QCH35_05760 [Methanomicrobiaceae archaeon]|nr:hypothetical protein [Methanomicrobiaceae archaeon]